MYIVSRHNINFFFKANEFPIKTVTCKTYISVKLVFVEIQYVRLWHCNVHDTQQEAEHDSLHRAHTNNTQPEFVSAVCHY